LRIDLADRRHAELQILKRFAAPILVDRVGEGLPVTR
jgi:uncharacterized protein YqeY